MPDRGVGSDSEEEEESLQEYPSDDSTGSGDGRGLVNVVMPDRGVSSDSEEEEEDIMEYSSDETSSDDVHGLVNVVLPDRGVGQLWVYDSQTDAWDQTVPAAGGPTDRNL